MKLVLYMGNEYADSVEEISRIYRDMRSELIDKGIKSKLIESSGDFYLAVDNVEKSKKVIEEYFPECMLYWKEPETATSPQEMEKDIRVKEHMKGL